MRRLLPMMLQQVQDGCCAGLGVKCMGLVLSLLLSSSYFLGGALGLGKVKGIKQREWSGAVLTSDTC